MTTEVKQMPDSRYILFPFYLQQIMIFALKSHPWTKSIEKESGKVWIWDLNDEQSIQLAKIMQAIEDKYSSELEGVFSEADQSQNAEYLRREWN